MGGKPDTTGRSAASAQHLERRDGASGRGSAGRPAASPQRRVDSRSGLQSAGLAEPPPPPSWPGGFNEHETECFHAEFRPCRQKPRWGFRAERPVDPERCVARKREHPDVAEHLDAEEVVLEWQTRKNYGDPGTTDTFPACDGMTFVRAESHARNAVLRAHLKDAATEHPPGSTAPGDGVEPFDMLARKDGVRLSFYIAQFAIHAEKAEVAGDDGQSARLVAKIRDALKSAKRLTPLAFELANDLNFTTWRGLSAFLSAGADVRAIVRHRHPTQIATLALSESSTPVGAALAKIRGDYCVCRLRCALGSSRPPVVTFEEWQADPPSRPTGQQAPGSERGGAAVGDDAWWRATALPAILKMQARLFWLASAAGAGAAQALVLREKSGTFVRLGRTSARLGGPLLPRIWTMDTASGDWRLGAPASLHWRMDAVDGARTRRGSVAEVDKETGSIWNPTLRAFLSGSGEWLILPDEAYDKRRVPVAFWKATLSETDLTLRLGPFERGRMRFTPRIDSSLETAEQ